LSGGGAIEAPLLFSHPREAELMSFTRTVRFGFSAMAVLGVVLTASPAWAQDPPPVVVVTGALDVVNQYNFRGIRQNSEGVSIWPYVDFGFTPYRGDGSLKTVGLNLGTWNAFHSQINEDDFGTGNKWYESDLYATLGLGFGATALAFTYTSYTSPADLFSHVKELAVKLSFDDSAALGSGALKPYGLVAFELDDAGQADAGDAKGTYLEFGVAPGYAGSRASLAVPIKVGLSASDYYEFGLPEDSKFGYFSIAGIVTVPLGAHANIHFGGEFQAFGDNLKTYNDQDTVGIGSIGLGFAF
jgi:hypothetical protein